MANEKQKQGRLEHKGTDFPNTFQLTSSVLENVARQKNKQFLNLIL